MIIKENESKRRKPPLQYNKLTIKLLDAFLKQPNIIPYAVNFLL